MPISPVKIKMLRRLLQSGTESKIAHGLEKVHPSDLTILFSELSPNETQRLVNSLFLVSKAGKTLLELPDVILPDILELIDNKKMGIIVSRLEPDDALFLLEKIPESRWPDILKHLPIDKKKSLDKLLLYPKESAGSVMTSNLVKVKADMTVEEAILAIRQSPTAEGVLYLYVVNDANHLVGVQSLRQLVTTAPHIKISEIMTTDVHAVLATDDQEKAATMVSQYNFLAVPVVNENRELLGMITVDDVIDIFEEEATEDIYHLAGLSEGDRAITPLKTKIKKRLPWMMLNLLTATMAALIISYFQSTLEEVVVLAIFLPILANIAGNAGIQTLTVISRSIALGEFSFLKSSQVVIKESMNGLVLGVVLGVFIGILAYIWDGNTYLGLVLLLATIVTLLFSSLSGAIIPVTFNRLKLDPAVGTSVVITLMTDGLSFLSILGFASLFLNYLR
jgi:magnesium transporter